MGRQRSRGLRLTRVGLWFLVFAVIVLLAASNTGNNGLFLVLAVMLAAFFVSHLLARHNLRHLEVRLVPAEEIFAGQPTHLRLELSHRGWLVPRWLLLVSVELESVEHTEDVAPQDHSPLLVHQLFPKQNYHDQLQLTFPARGRYLLSRLRIGTLFPVGFFHKELLEPLDLEVLAFPALLSTARRKPTEVGPLGGRAARRTGWGHDLFALRRFRHGDDPRGIHWKQSARTGSLILKENETEENPRLAILLDNAVGSLEEPDQKHRFEYLVSEAATEALHFLDRGFEVSLVTRDAVLPYGAGSRHRYHMLSTLALLTPLPRAATPLRGSASAGLENDRELRLSVDPLPKAS